jgi:zinc D-Ala-D-Ala carboxypeptidase
MQLSTNFSLEELTKTNLNLPNIPSEKEITNLKELVTNVLQPVRELLGSPICVNSGFRSRLLNKSMGGAVNSQHCKGEAADLDVVDNAHLFNLIRQHLPFDQLIWEGGNNRQPAWVHVSYRATGNRKQVLRMRVVDGIKKYTVL